MSFPPILEAEWKLKVYDKANEIDPNDELCWYSLSVGFALQAGLSPEDANHFARYIRYNTNLG